MKNKIKGFKKKIIVHPLVFKAFQSYMPIDDECRKTIFGECCKLIQDAHNKTNEVKKKNENCPQEQSCNYRNMIGNDPNIKSLVKKMPPRIVLCEENIKMSHKMQMFNVMNKKYLFNFSENISKLNSFEVPPTFNDDDLMKVAPHFLHLKVLKFFKCKNITDSGLIYLSNHWPEGRSKLNELMFYDCDSITDAGTETLIGSCKDIKTLFLYGSKFSTSFQFVGRTCSNLRKLVLGTSGNLWAKNTRKIQNVTDDVILSIAEGCQQLRSLNINHCDQVSDQALGYLAHHSGELKSLEIFGCTKISMEGLIDGLKFRVENYPTNTWRNVTFDAKETKLRWNMWKQYNDSITEKENKTKLYAPPRACFKSTAWTPPIQTRILVF